MQAPLCFASQDLFRLWATAPVAVRCTNPCRDCQPGYQTRMKRAGRCAHPETMFALDEEGAVYGYWPRAS